MSSAFDNMLKARDVKRQSIKEKSAPKHPWAKTVKDEFSHRLGHVHNSVYNPEYPKPKENKKKLYSNQERYRFQVFGVRYSKEFLFCKKLLEGLYKYRSDRFELPMFRGVSSVEWKELLNDLKLKYRGMTYCLCEKLVVILNGNVLGGEEQLKEFIKKRYEYDVQLDYHKEGITEFASYMKATGRAFTYMNIAIDNREIGSLIFMMYNDIVPNTCENFMRLCKAKSGGYKGTPVHRIVQDSWIQCGGFGLKSNNLGCENFIVPHDKRGVLGMANDGRDIDCSTQFFVLLQPSQWMNTKYVAFGQLIDGERVLAEIEKVDTWHEAPMKNITIVESGVLNLECQDIRINHGTVQYIDGHIDDLNSIKDWLAELLFDKLFMALEFIHVVGERSQLGEGEQEENQRHEDKDIRATERFLIDKKEIERQLKKSSGKPSDAISSENNDFDVEDYVYEPGEYSPEEESVSEKVEKQKPFYIPLTDVPYPGEVDSTYDMKAFLRGDYCLPIDLRGDTTKNMGRLSLAVRDSLISNVQRIRKEPIIIGDVQSSDEEYEILDSEDEKEVQLYLRLYSDVASFAGPVIKSIAGKTNFVARIQQNRILHDESLRELRVFIAEKEKQRQQKVLVSLGSQDLLPHIGIKRRPTGFITPTDLKKIIGSRGIIDLHDEEDGSDESCIGSIPSDIKHRTGSIEEDIGDKGMYRRKPTGVPSGEELAKLLAKDDDDDDDNDLPETLGQPVQGTRQWKKKEGGKRQQKVGLKQSSDSIEIDNRSKVQFRDGFPEYMGLQRVAVSALHRLFNDIKPLIGDPAPTLKSFKPIREVQERHMLLTKSSPIDPVDNTRFDQSSIGVAIDSVDQFITVQHGKTTQRKISSDYVKIINQAEHRGRKAVNSIRSIEYSRTRPVLTVSEYQLRNHRYQQQLKEQEEKGKTED